MDGGQYGRRRSWKVPGSVRDMALLSLIVPGGRIGAVSADMLPMGSIDAGDNTASKRDVADGVDRVEDGPAGREVRVWGGAVAGVNWREH